MSAPVMKSAAFVAALAVLVGSAAGISAVVRSLGAHLTKLPIQPKDERQHTIPREIKGWPDPDTGWCQQGQDRDMTAEEAEELGTGDTISRAYIECGPKVGPKPRVILLHTAYYTGMIDTVPHVPDRCLTAAGTQLDGPTVEVAVPIDMSLLSPDPWADTAKGVVYRMRNHTIQRHVRLPRGVENLRMTMTPFKDKTGRRFFAGYFFIANGGVVASANGVRLLAFRLQDDYAYYLKVQFTIYDVETAEGAGQMAGEMLNSLFPELALRVPDWVEVEAGNYPEKTGGQASPPG
ncbi:MAG: hypothetical protein J0L61_03875 [Planctomycetes bacterium]|nr:hypothetical protein [Planctomycetota bacterium]